jgi:predicted alpha/beta hydrolase family esterase
MTVQILFVQGAGAGTHDEWDNKLVANLERALGLETNILYPRMPDEDDPRYATWKATLVETCKWFEDGAILVGHSIGGAILLHVLAEGYLPFRPGALILIAVPFIGAGGWASGDIAAGVDLAERLPVGMPIFLHHGTDDDTVPFAHAELYARAIPQAVLRPVPRGDHQLNNDLSGVAEDIRSLGI